MPRVPTYDNFTTAPAAGGLPQFQAPQAPDVAGQQAQAQSRALSAAGDAVFRIGQAIQADVNQAKVDDATNQLVDARTKMLVEVSQLKGRNALERPDGKALPDEYSEKYQEAVRQIEQGLGNDAQRAVFRRQASQFGRQFSASVTQHMLGEQREFAKETDLATINTAVNQAALLYGDATIRAESTNAINAVVDRMAQREGWDEKTREAKRLEAMSPMHAGIIDALVANNNVKAAQEYYAQNSAGMSMQARAKVQDRLTASNEIVEEQSQFDRIMAAAQGDERIAMSMAKELQGKVRDGVERRVRQAISDDNQITQARAKEVYKASWSEYFQTGRISTKTAATLKAEFPDIYRGITDYQDALLRRRKDDADGVDYEKQYGVFYGFVRMATESPAKFADMDLRTVAPLVSKSQLSQLTNMQASINKPDAKASELGNMLTSAKTVLGPAIRAAGIDTGAKPGTSKAKEFDEFNGALSMRLLDFASKNQRAPTDEEIKREGMNLLRTYVEKDPNIFSIFSSGKKGYQILQSDPVSGESKYVAARFKNIPEAIRNDLLESYYSKNPQERGQRNGFYTSAPVSEKAMREVEEKYTRLLREGERK